MSNYSMEREVEAAVQWWSEQLQQSPAHTVDGSLREWVANRVSASCPPVSREQIERFTQALKVRLFAHIKRFEVDPEHPRWGAALRCIGVTYGPDPELAEALSEAKIDCPSLRLPFNTRMWIDPGCVTVRDGGEEKIIWQGSIKKGFHHGKEHSGHSQD